MMTTAHAHKLAKFSDLNVVDFPQALQLLLDKQLTSIDTLLTHHDSYTFDTLFGALEQMDDELEHFWGPLSHLHAVMNTPQLRDCYEACLPMLSAYEAALSHNTKLYEAIRAIDIESLTSTQQKIVHDALRDFTLAGVGLATDDKIRFEQIQARLSELSNQFENHVLDAGQAFTLHVEEASRLSGIPAHALEEAASLAQEKGLAGHLFSLEYPSYSAVITYAEDRTIRQEIYYAFTTRASDQGPHALQFDNSPIMQEMLALRHEKALLLGFSNYAELSIASKMADSAEQILSFLNDLVARAYPQAMLEMTALKAFAKTHYHLEKIEPWDLSFLSEKKKQSEYTISEEDLRPYFPLPTVMTGLFTILQRLYGIRFEQLFDQDVWHQDVTCYRVVDENAQLRGYIYLDLFARPHKRNGAWMDSCQGRRQLDEGQIQHPIALLTCNFAKAQKGRLATLSHDEVVTLFHEMGHCLHHILTQVNYLAVAGINGVEWDAVELPSQFLENWCWNEEALALMSAHVDTGQPLPAAMLANLMAARNFHTAMAMLRQLEFSLFDFRIHQSFDATQANFIARTLQSVREKTAVLASAEFNRFQHSFSHIFGGGYAAGYYSYKWAEVLSSDAFSRFEQEGVFNRQTGQDFLHCILEVGASVKASSAFRCFMGRDASIDALLKHNGIQS